MDLGWKADTCKMQKHHAEYGTHCDQRDQGQTLAQIISDSDADESKTKNFGQKGGSDFQSALKKAQRWAKSYKSSEDIPDSAIPESYDFRNIEGFDFTNPLRD